jgi:hypothetical protein
MGKSALEENVLKHFLAIDLCLENSLLMPALVLIYNGIDTFAALSRPVTKDKVTRQDFISWCDRYLLPVSSLECSGLDLYAARCGILHTYTAVSDLSNGNEAAELHYYLGSINKEKYQKIIDSKYPNKVVIVSLENLDKAFKTGYFSFMEDIKKEPQKESLVYERARHFFLDRPAV